MGPLAPRSQKVFSGSFAGCETIFKVFASPLNPFPPGVYFIKLNAGVKKLSRGEICVANLKAPLQMV